MNKVRITKIGIPDNPDVDTATKEIYNLGEFNKLSPFVDYYVEGELIGDVTVGKSVLMVRENRNGVAVNGMFQTSTVTSITPLDNVVIFRTRNSIYKLEHL